MSINNNKTKLFFYSNVDNFIGVNASLLDGYLELMCAAGRTILC